ncbi:hypothetical protein K501DRAFT_251887 [Backusella circina FSU 941]|nr:hypothetical protein K501DRAFT_251887 [Backusella circina FSU 941]
MSDTNWCTFCDKAVSPFSESLYCSEKCLRLDALRNHPLLGYKYPEFTDFPHPKPSTTVPTHFYQSLSTTMLISSSPPSTSSSRSSSCISITLPKSYLCTNL